MSDRELDHLALADKELMHLIREALLAAMARKRRNQAIVRDPRPDVLRARRVITAARAKRHQSK